MEQKMGRFTAEHPWAVLAAGAVIQILTGIPAAWGAFQQPVMEEYGFSEAQAGYAFALLIAAFGVGCLLGGFFRTAGVPGAPPSGERPCSAGVSLGQEPCRRG